MQISVSQYSVHRSVHTCTSMSVPVCVPEDRLTNLPGYAYMNIFS